MKKPTVVAIMICTLLPLMTGCGDNAGSIESKKSKKVDAVFFGSTENTSGFQKATINAKTHYDLIRAARKAEEAKDYEQAIKLLNEALPSAEFKFEKAAVYTTLAEMYAAENDLENEMKYRLLDAEYTGNPNTREESLRRAEQIKTILPGSDSRE